MKDTQLLFSPCFSFGFHLHRILQLEGQAGRGQEPHLFINRGWVITDQATCVLRMLKCIDKG